MTLSRIKALATNTASRPFTGREDEIQVFDDCWKTYLRSGSLAVQVFYGIGGVGKTTLLRHLRQRAATLLPQPHIVSIDLEACHIVGPLDLLFEVYRQAGVSSYPFEFALMTSWTYAGRDISEFRNRLMSIDSPFLNAADLVAGWASGLSPVAFIRRVGEAVRDYVVAHHGRDADTIRSITQLDPYEVEERLPYYLGMALARKAEDQATPMVFFVDTLDNLSIKTGFGNTKLRSDYWIKETIGSAVTGLWFLISREKLDWAKKDDDWEPILRQRVLGELSPTDCERFFDAIPVTERPIRDRIIQASGGLPLYLDLCATIYTSRKQTGLGVEAELFNLNRLAIVERYFSHLGKAHADAVRALSLFDEFDQQLFAVGLRAWNIALPQWAFEDVRVSALAVPLSIEKGRYRIHRIVRDHVISDTSAEKALAIVSELVKWLGRLNNPDASYRAWLAGRTLVLILSQKVELSKSDASDLVYLLHQWLDGNGASAMAPYLEATLLGTGVTACALTSLKAFAMKEMGRTFEAKATWKVVGTLLDDTPVGAMIRYAIAHTDHLAGDYSGAERTYAVLASAKGGYVGDNSRLWALRQTADIHMLRGEFARAISGFDLALEQGPSEPSWRAECLRLKAHVFRFCLHGEEADDHYRQAFDIANASGLEQILAKLLTNKAERRCFENPAAAIIVAEEAVEANRHVGNLIEVGKCLVASSYAHICLGRPDEALTLTQKAMELQTETGYKAGLIFALLASSIAQWCNGNVNESLVDCVKARGFCNELGVYGFLPLFRDWLTNAASDGDVRSAANWLDFNKTLKGFRLYAKALGVK